ncbi:MAG: extracellular solute-binding protein [Micrococcales bacterium]|nr:extracellular solute-binding protein [Micrococcales bacterium]
MTRRFTAFAAAVGLALTMTACSSGKDAPDEQPPPEVPAEEPAQPEAPPEPEAPVDEGCTEDLGTLTMWVDETRERALADAVAQFKVEKCVTIQMVKKNFDDLRQDFNTQVAAGEGPDITVGANDWLGEFKSNGIVAPIVLGEQEAKLAPTAIDAYKSGGQLYGVPYAMENIALVRNNAVLADTAATTFDELIEEAKGAGTTYSVLLQVGETGDPYHMTPLQNSFGAKVFQTDENGDYVSDLDMGGDAGHAFAEYIAKLGADKVLSKDITGDIAKQEFLDGNAPYIITGPWNTSDFAAAGMDITVLAIPSAGGQPASPFMGVPGFYLSANSPNTLLAQEFLVNYVTRADVQISLFQAGGRTPASLEAQADPIVANDPIAAGFAQAAGDAIVQPSIPAMNEVWTPLGHTEVEIISGTAKDPVAAWDAMVENIAAAIAKQSD